MALVPEIRIDGNRSCSGAIRDLQAQGRLSPSGLIRGLDGGCGIITVILRGFGTENTDGLDRRGDKPLPVSNEFHLEARINSAHLAEAPAQSRPGQPALCQIRYVPAAFDQNLAVAPVNHYDFVPAVNGADMNSLHLLEFVNLCPVPPRILGPHIQDGPTG